MKKSKKLLALLAAVTVGVSCFAFAACGGSDEEDNEIVLTENTDFAALVSEKVDEDGWKKAFGVQQNVTRSIDSRFGVEQYYNSTLKHVGYTFDGEIESCIKLLSMTENDDRYIGFFLSVGADRSIEEADQSIYFAKYANTGNIELYNEIRDEVNNKFTGEFEKTSTAADDENYDRMNATFALYDYKLFTPDCSEFFSRFTYNDEINAYEFKDGILNASYSTENSEFEYSHIVIKIINGRLAYLLAEISDRLSYINYYYDFGTTEVTLPLDKISGGVSDEENSEIILTENTDFAALASEKVDEDGWTSVFDINQYYDCTLRCEEYRYIENEIDTGCAYMLWKLDGDVLYINCRSLPDIDTDDEKAEQSNYLAYYADTGIIELYQEEQNENTYEFTGEYLIYSGSPEDEDYDVLIQAFNIYTYKLFTPDFGKYFSQFTFNEEEGSYEFNDGFLTANIVGEYGTIANYRNIVIKIINGKLAYLNAELVFSDDYIVEVTDYFYDFGTTEVTLPLDKIKN